MSLTRNRRSPTDVRLAGKSPRRSSTTAAASNELIVVPVDHIVQFYATEDVLVDTLAQIVETGLDAGEACLVIATGAHRARLHARLRRRGRDMPEARRDGRYRALDADHMLQTLMVAGELDPVRFKRKIERAMRRAAQGGRAVRVLSELGAQLWLAGSRKAALRLEALWNELRQRSTPMFSLLCAFPEHLLAMGDARTALAAAHGRQTRAVRSAVAPPLLSAHARVQAVARLRRDNHALQAEVARRQRMEERLRRTELRYRDLFEASRDGILTIEPDTGRISEANHAAAELLGRPRERIVGHDLWQLGLFPTRASARAALSAMRGQPPPQWEALPLPSRNGRERVAQMAASFVRSDGFATIQCTLRDVSERKQLERDAAARAAELEAIQAVTDVALAHSSLDDLLHELMERLRTVLGVDNVAVLLLDATGRELSLYQARGPEEEVAGRVHVPLGRGVAGLIAATREPLIIGDLRTVPVENPFLRERLRSLMGVPLLVADRLIGVMHVSTILPHAFAPREVRLLQLVADRAARAIERAQLQQEADQARHAAVERANQLYATIEAIADGVVVFDYTGRLTQMNATAQRLLGFAGTPRYTAASAGYGSRHTRSAAGRALTAEHWPVQRVLRGEVITGSQAVDLTIQGAGGRDLDVSVSGAPVLDSDGAVQGAVCVFRDVTAQRQLERRTNEALEALLAMAGALLDVPGDDAAGTAPSEAPARHATLPTAEGAPPAARRLAHLTCEVLACQRVGILAIDTETRLMTPIAVAGLTPDQERQWWADQAARPQTFGADSEPELLRRFDAGEVIVVDMTKAPYASRPNPYGISTTLVAPMRLGPRLIGMLAVDFGGAPHHFTEQEHALAGAVARLAALVIERERLLREREEARASALVAQETTRQMHTFLGIAGHEFRTPVTSIKAGVQIAERALQAYLREVAPTADTRPLQRAQSLLLRADQQANRLNRLIEDILDATRSQAGTLQLRNEMGDLVAVVRQTVETHVLTWPGRAITLDLPETPVNLLMDADRIEQVIANFLTNALKFSAEDQPVMVRLTVNGGVARVAVSDHGPGLPAALHTLVWEAFYRADADRQQTGSTAGLGLGLHICRTLIKRHGGQVGVQSTEGEGATFWFELPLVSADAAVKGNGGVPRDATQPAT